MTTKSNTTPEIPTPFQIETDRVNRLAALLLESAGKEPHAHVIAAMATALGLLGEAYPCCRTSLGQVLMQMGLRMQSPSEASPSHHVH